LLRWGWLGVGPILVLAIVGVSAASDVSAARAAVWRATLMPTSSAVDRIAAREEGALSPPSAVSLRRLATLVSAARSGDDTAAWRVARSVDRARLAPEEVELLEATTDFVAHATRVEERGPLLARVLVRTAWTNRARLRSIAGAWTRAPREDEE